ncbi:Periphilin-1 [Oryzias melastigma]|uniref:Periphilin-1 n=1 Tax=Oryzias melastigma TaxID=30732 RepID=A0A834CP31_ORYME|nr:Periphilin-1 [Oryzias melastigma]
MDYPREKDSQYNQDEKRPIRRVRSPSRPRAWHLPNIHKPRIGRGFYKPHFSRDDHSFYRGGHKYHYFKPRLGIYRKDYHPPKPHRVPVREEDEREDMERQREKEKVKDERGKEQYDLRESIERNSPTRPSSTPRPVLPRATSSRDKDVQFTVSLSDRHQSSERDHRASKSKDREWSRDMELPLTASQTAARDRAIQQKRREIDEVYYQECEIFSLVVKMLIAKDPSLEGPIQSALQENLRDIGKRCVVAMKKFIEEYDSRDLLN